MDSDKPDKPLILAPAGDKASFLAALAAGADAVYCGLKQFSARMAAINFSMGELKVLTTLAHEKGAKVFVTLNTLLKPDELDPAARLLWQLGREAAPDGIIVQDLALLMIADQVGFAGQRYLSTLANLSVAGALGAARRRLNIDGVVLPRELTIDEIKMVAAQCPPDLKLEVFVHGALCYGVSGRCYWSSYLGGKSSLRGRCVQPCRRRYTVQGAQNRFFSCRDLCLDVLARLLLNVPQIGAWKIEGRKKGPHYVFHTVSAYRLLRDHGGERDVKKEALALLSMAMGRECTHYNFLSHRRWNPVDGSHASGSGLQIGSIQGTALKPFLTPKTALFPGDMLRLGYEDDKGHAVVRVKRAVPRKGRFFLRPAGRGKQTRGRPVFLIDRLEPHLAQEMTALEKQLRWTDGEAARPPQQVIRRPKAGRKKMRPFEMPVWRYVGHGDRQAFAGLWLSARTAAERPPAALQKVWWWLPPVVWPETEDAVAALVGTVIKNGAVRFVLNAPWQTALFPSPGRFHCWAGPFCNASNPMTIDVLRQMGFEGVIVGPELGAADYLVLPRQSPLPLGIVLSGNWPLCVSRIAPTEVAAGRSFTSPKGEVAYRMQYDGDSWIYPNWRLDLTSHREELAKAGYACFVHLEEPLPDNIAFKNRPGLWNWSLGLK